MNTKITAPIIKFGTPLLDGNGKDVDYWVTSFHMTEFYVFINLVDAKTGAYKKISITPQELVESGIVVPEKLINYVKK